MADGAGHVENGAGAVCDTDASIKDALMLPLDISMASA